MHAQVGDRLVVAGSGHTAARVGTIVAVSSGGGAPFRVRWDSDGHESGFWPGVEARIEEAHTHHHDGTAAHLESAKHEHAITGEVPMHSKTWHVDLYLTESGNQTSAHAVLKGDAPENVRAVGTTRRNPHDPAVPEIGDEVAAARALRQLAETLVDLASADLAGVTGKPANISAAPLVNN